MYQLITENKHGYLSVNSLGHPGCRFITIETKDDGQFDTVVLIDRREIESLVDFLTNTLERWDMKGPID